MKVACPGSRGGSSPRKRQARLDGDGRGEPELGCPASAWESRHHDDRPVPTTPPSPPIVRASASKSNRRSRRVCGFTMIARSGPRATSAPWTSSGCDQPTFQWMIRSRSASGGGRSRAFIGRRQSATTRWSVARSTSTPTTALARPSRRGRHARCSPPGDALGPWSERAVEERQPCEQDHPHPRARRRTDAGRRRPAASIGDDRRRPARPPRRHAPMARARAWRRENGPA